MIKNKKNLLSLPYFSYFCLDPQLMNKRPVIFNADHRTNSSSDTRYGIPAPVRVLAVNYLWETFNRDHGSTRPITLHKQAKQNQYLIHKPHGPRAQIANSYSLLFLSPIFHEFDEKNSITSTISWYFHHAFMEHQIWVRPRGHPPVKQQVYAPTSAEGAGGCHC